MSIPIALVPKYQVTLGDGHVRHGLGWELILAMPSRPNSCLTWEQDLSLGFAWYPRVNPESSDSSIKAQTTWRTWYPKNLVGGDGWGLRLGGGAGAFVGLGGAGPRLETRFFIGSVEQSARIFGIFISGAYEPDLVTGHHRAAFAAGLEMPVQI
jgi:hypothetical protein